MSHKLRVEYPTIDSFEREYAQDISKGGIFVPTRDQIEIRESVEIELKLAFEGRSVFLEGEVVHCIPPEMAAAGAKPGVAVQFLIRPEDVRSQIGVLSRLDTKKPGEPDQGNGRRAAPRWRARVPVSIKEGGSWVAGHTRNVSCSGMLAVFPGKLPPLGCKLTVRIKFATGDSEMKIAGKVARHVEVSDVACLGIEFDVSEARGEEMAEFMNQIRTHEHTRRLGGINGPIEDLGIQRLLSMFGSCSPAGMLTLVRGAQEGYVSFNEGMLYAEIGPLSGLKALEVLLSWSDGSFAFEGQADDGLSVGDPIAVAELAGVDPAPTRSLAPDIFRIPPAATLVAVGKPGRSGLDKTEQVLLDLAAVGMTVAKVVEIIPESDADIYAALQNLIDEGLMTLE